VNVRDIDRACRAVFEGADCADLFVHGTGHGVGLDIHEEPFLGASGDAELVAGDVVTVEPGLYRVGTGGIRIEDLVVVTPEGHRNLTTHPKDSPCPPSPQTI
jgi:Xaa-Pro aminopeptidase